MDLHYRYEWRCFAVWLGCKWVSQYFIYFPSEFKFYWPFTRWIKNEGLDHSMQMVLGPRFWSFLVLSVQFVPGGVLDIFSFDLGITQFYGLSLIVFTVDVSIFTTTCDLCWMIKSRFDLYPECCGVSPIDISTDQLVKIDCFDARGPTVGIHQGLRRHGLTNQ